MGKPAMRCGRKLATLHIRIQFVKQVGRLLLENAWSEKTARCIGESNIVHSLHGNNIAIHSSRSFSMDPPVALGKVVLWVCAWTHLSAFCGVLSWALLTVPS